MLIALSVLSFLCDLTTLSIAKIVYLWWKMSGWDGNGREKLKFLEEILS
jgi:hypothetical protein